MLLSRSFVLGLLAYLRQAALSLHRAPGFFVAPMRDYYAARELPSPARVITHIDTTTRAGAGLVARLFGRSIVLDDNELFTVGDSLRTLQAILDGQVVESEEEKVRLRIVLSGAEELIRRKLGRQAREVENVEHLNETPGLGLRPLSEVAGVGWPDSN